MRCRSFTVNRFTALTDMLASYSPVMPQPSLAQRFVCLFTRAGRGRRRLWKACGAKDEARLLPGLCKCLEGLRRDAHRDCPATAAVIGEILLYLAWRNLSNGLLAEASRWLKELGQYAPDRSERILLRWELLLKLASAGQIDSYLQEAAIFLADTQLAAVDPGDTALAVVATAYEKASRAACKTLINAAASGLADGPQGKAVLSLCLCPDRFATAIDAASWESRIDPDCLAFSALMQADALLVRAKAEEHRGAWQAMEACAQQSLHLVPSHEAATFWLIRARLHQPGVDSLRDVDRRTLARAKPDWARLSREVALHQSPTLEHARVGVEMLQQKHGPLDATERELLIVLLEKALTVNPSWPPAEMAASAALCAAVEAVVGRLAWTQLSLAFAETRCGQQYRSAIARLERDDVSRLPLAISLERAARILAGSPRLDSFGADPDSCFSAMERAIAAIVLPGQTAAPNQIIDLQQRLDQAADDPWCVYLPALRAVAEGLSWLLRRIAHHGVSNTPTAWSPANDTPRWLRWLHARISLFTENGSVLHGSDCSDSAVAWSLENWWSLYGIDAQISATQIEPFRRRLDELAWPASIKATIAALRHARGGEEHQPTAQSAATASEGVGDLGKVCNDLWRDELKLEVAYVKARRQFAAAGSVSSFDALAGQLARLSWLTQKWWEPVVLYWRGVAVLKNTGTNGEAILEGLVEGPKGPEARAQLALAALRRQDLASAARWLAGIEARFPAVLYAQGLLEMRRGNLDRACASLQSLVTRFGPATAPYGQAAERLLAAIAELQGNAAVAERLYRECLVTVPRDAVTSARLARLLLLREYSDAIPGIGADIQEINALLRQGSQTVDWCSSYQLLHRLLAGPTEQLDAVASELAAMDAASDRPSAWRQLLLRRYLVAGAPTKALHLAADHPDDPSPEFVRTRLILRSWALVEQLAAAPAPSELAIAVEAAAALIREIDAVPAAAAEHLSQWRFFLGQSIALAHAPDAASAADAWRDLAPQPWAELPALWSSEEPLRQQAAGELRALLDLAKSPAWARSHLVLRAICDWILGNDDEYRTAYAALQTDLDVLPIRGVSLWLAAARIAFARHEWGELLQGELPPCVADLAEPNVRFLLGLAYARAAAEDAARGEARGALQKVRQARTTLNDIDMDVATGATVTAPTNESFHGS